MGWSSGDSTEKQAENQQLANSQQMMKWDQQFMDMLQTRFGRQSAIFSYMKGVLQPMIDNPQGFGQQALTAMRSSASDAVAQTTANATKAAQEVEAARNGNTELPSGVNAQIAGQIANAGAQQTAQAQNQITLSNEQQKQSNFWNAISGLSQQEQLLNPQSFGSLAVGGSNAAANAGNSVANLGNAYNASLANSPFNQVMGAIGGLAKTALANWNPGGLFASGATQT